MCPGMRWRRLRGLHPELSCTGGPVAVSPLWGIFPVVYCAGQEAVFEFLQNVLDEVLALFPGKFIHVGGDECPKERWQACADCQRRIREEGLADEHELQELLHPPDVPLPGVKGTAPDWLG